MEFKVYEEGYFHSLEWLRGHNPLSYYDKRCIVYVKRLNWLGRWEKGFVVDRVKLKMLELERKTESLSKMGYKFRNGPVPTIHKYKCSIHGAKKSGLMKEAKTNEGTHQAFKRAKRESLVKDLIDWDGITHYNSQRGWKRSKKRKQYE